MRAELNGAKWVVKINGMKSLNGKRYGATIHGEIIDCNGANIYEAAREILESVEEQNEEMTLPDSIHLVIAPVAPDSAIRNPQSALEP